MLRREPPERSASEPIDLILFICQNANFENIENNLKLINLIFTHHLEISSRTHSRTSVQESILGTLPSSLIELS